MKFPKLSDNAIACIAISFFFVFLAIIGIVGFHKTNTQETFTKAAKVGLIETTEFNTALLDEVKRFIQSHPTVSPNEFEKEEEKVQEEAANIDQETILKNAGIQ